MLKLVELVINRSEQKKISISNTVNSPILVFADKKMINSVLHNLLSNAVKFTKQFGHITIAAKETKNNMIEIAIQDTGIGMSKNMLENYLKLVRK